MQVLLYDGVCGLCNGLVQFMLAQDPAGALRFAPLQGPFAAGVIAQYPALREVDSLVLVETDEAGEATNVRTQADAALALASYLGWPWRIAAVLRILPSFMLDGAYNLVARYRYRVFGRYDSCPLPSPEVRARFID